MTRDGNEIFLTFGLEPRTGKVLEVFYSAGFRSGSQLEFVVQDACILLSLLLQHGADPAAIAKSLGWEELPDRSLTHGSIIGLIVEELKR